MDWKRFATALVITLSHIVFIVVGVIVIGLILWGIWELGSIFFSWVGTFDGEDVFYTVISILCFLGLARWVSYNYGRYRKGRKFWDYFG